MHDIEPFAVADAVADFSGEDRSMALRWIARTGVVCTTNQLLRDLLHSRAAHDASAAVRPVHEQRRPG